MSLPALNILVIIEHDNHNLSSNTGHLLNAARQLVRGQTHYTIDAFVVGYECDAVQQALMHEKNITTIFLCNDRLYQHSLAEDITPLIAKIARNYTHILAPSSTYGKNIIPRLGGVLDLQPISDVISIIDPRRFKRPIYAGSAFVTLVSDERIQLLTIRTSAFATPVDLVATSNPKVELLAALPALQLSQFIEETIATSVRPELGNARLVVAGGRGLQNAENFSLLYQLADKLNAAVGASRAAVDAGFAANDLQVGQTGKMVAPDIYFAIGISGAVQHLAGIRDAKIIVAINKDADAPIFSFADYGICADLFDVVPELIDKL